MPLQRRLPKRGFRSPNRKRYAIVKLSQLERFESGSVVDAAALEAAGLVRGHQPIKLLGNGTLTRKLTIKVDKASSSARDAIAAAGGTLEVDDKSNGADAASADTDGAGE